MQVAMDLTMTVQKAAARGLAAGLSTTEVQAFLDDAHRKLGGRPAGAPVQFGEATAYPHGVPYGQVLADGDMVLIDTGCFIHGYRSDITRTYVFGDPTPRQREIWELERRPQQAGFGPGYKVPGLPHRTGHGIGMDVHEEACMVKGNITPLAEGMCFSDEPTICIYGEFGVRLEDTIYMTASGARWFTRPAPSCDAPFGDEP